MLRRNRSPSGIWARAPVWYLLRMMAALWSILPPAEIGRAEQVNDNPPVEPILRVEAGDQHSAQISRIDTDAANRFAVTASFDKTVRVWSLPNGRSVSVLRFPIDYGKALGKSHAVAISPDGNTVAAGGDSGGVSHHNIFLFDRASGQLIKRLIGLPDGVLHLAYSHDGKLLAASLAGRNGIRVFDVVKGYRPLPSDTIYGDSSYWLSFDRRDRLVTGSDDGLVRLYATRQYFNPVAQFRSGAHRPYSVEFSPDGTHVAVGFSDAPLIVVLKGSNMTQPFEPDIAGSGYRNLQAVGWSKDGHYLFAGGQWSGEGVNQLRRWSKGGHGEFKDVPAGPYGYETIMQLRGLASGHILVLHTDGFGLTGPDAKMIHLQKSLGVLNFMRGFGPLQISADGRTVEVAAYQPRHTYRFGFGERLVEVDRPADDTLEMPIIHDAPGLVIRDWEDLARPTVNVPITPTVNGMPITLKLDEGSYSLAIAPDAQRFVLGCDWSLRMLDREGRQIWTQDVPGEAWHVNITRDGRLLIVAYGDGTIRWHRLTDGSELLALFIHPDGKRWVAWTPQGYYDASIDGDGLVGWQVNRGYDQIPDFYKFQQFRARFNRPEVIQELLQTASLEIDEAVRAADRKAGRPVNQAAAPVIERLPKVKIIGPPKRTVDRRKLRIEYRVDLPVPDDPLRLEAIVNGAKIEAQMTPYSPLKGSTRYGALHMTIPRQDSRVSIIAYGAKGPSEQASIDVHWAGSGGDPKPTLYVLAIGISEYRDKKLQLRFAAKDADEFLALAKAQEGGIYEKVISYPQMESLKDNKATYAEIRQALSWLNKQMTDVNDTAMVFLAGHGTTMSGHYRFLPYDYDPDPERRESSTIPDDYLRADLKRIHGKKLLFLDTCYSADAFPRPIVETFANDMRAPENSIVVFASSQGIEVSEESEQWNEGAFTKALLDGLHGKSAPEHTMITENELEKYIRETVPKMTAGRQHPEVAKPPTIPDFIIAKSRP